MQYCNVVCERDRNSKEKLEKKLGNIWLSENYFVPLHREREGKKIVRKASLIGQQDLLKGQQELLIGL